MVPEDIFEKIVYIKNGRDFNFLKPVKGSALIDLRELFSQMAFIHAVYLSHYLYIELGHMLSENICSNLFKRGY